MASRLCLTHCRINVFAVTVALFDESILGIFAENLFNFVLRHMMLAVKLLDNFVQPNDSRQLQMQADEEDVDLTVFIGYPVGFPLSQAILMKPLKITNIEAVQNPRRAKYWYQ